MMFYSRRIGHAPSYIPEVDNVNSFSKIPEFTNIINAIKLTGTTRNGVSVGICKAPHKGKSRYTKDGMKPNPWWNPSPIFSWDVSRK